MNQKAKKEGECEQSGENQSMTERNDGKIDCCLAANIPIYIWSTMNHDGDGNEMHERVTNNQRMYAFVICEKKKWIKCKRMLLFFPI